MDLTASEEKLVAFQDMFGEVSEEEIAQLAKVRKSTIESFKEKMGIVVEAVPAVSEKEDSKIVFEEPKMKKEELEFDVLPDKIQLLEEKKKRKAEVTIRLLKTLKLKNGAVIPRSVYRDGIAKNLMAALDKSLYEVL